MSFLQDILQTYPPVHSLLLKEPTDMKHFIIAAEIYLAGGCFWGTEHFLKQIRGVESTEVGYANSIINQPTYQQVCSGETNAAETVKVVYDPETVNLSLLL